MDRSTGVAELVRGARARQQGDWALLVERYTPLVLSVVHGYRLQDPDAQDVVQTLWLRLVEHLDEIRDPEALPGWIVVTTRNECRRDARRRRRSVPVDLAGSALVAETMTPSGAERSVPLDVAVVEDLTTAVRHRVLLEAVAALPEPHRALLRMLLTDPPMSYADISGRLGIPVGGIGPTRARALQRIRAHPAVVACMAGDGASSVPTRSDPASRAAPHPGRRARRGRSPGP